MIFVNNPVGLDTTGNTALIVNKSLLSPNDSVISVPCPNVTVFPSGFPESTLGCPVKPFTLQVLVIHRTRIADDDANITNFENKERIKQTTVK